MKLFAKITVLILIVLICLITLFINIVDPNDYKTEIQALAKQNLNRQLEINGDLSWTLFPKLGINIAKIAIKNPPEFNNENLLSIDKATLNIQVLPLFNGEIKLGVLTIDGLQLNILTQLGQSNLDNLGPASQPKSLTSDTVSTTDNRPSAELENTSQPFFELNKSSIEGIKITNTVIKHVDKTKNTQQNMHIENIDIAAFSLGKATDFKLSTTLSTAKFKAKLAVTSTLFIPADLSNVKLDQLTLNSNISGADLAEKNIKIALKSNITYTIKNKLLDVNALLLKIDDIVAKGDLSVQANKKTKIRYRLNVNKIDLNPYLGLLEDPNSTTESKKSSASSSTHNELKKSAQAKTKLSKVEPDLSFLNTLDIQGDLVVDSILFKKIKIEKVTSHLIINKGKLRLQPITAKLYDGSLFLTSSVTSKNKFSVSAKLKKINTQPLLNDALNLDILSGQAALSFKGTGNGLSEYRILHNLKGKGQFKLADGRLYGINASHELRVLKAKFNGQHNENKDYKKQTDFSFLTGKYSIKNGTIKNNYLMMRTPIASLHGKGDIDLLANTINYQLKIKPKSTSKSNKKAKSDMFDLSRVSIPFFIHGPFDNLKFEVDSTLLIKTLLKEQEAALKKEAKRKLEKDQKKLQKKLDKHLDKHLDSENKNKVNKEINRALSKWLN